MEDHTLSLCLDRGSEYNFQESFLHYLWKTGNFDHRSLATTEGKALKILERGTHNHGAGPDFLEAKVLCEGVTWAGHVEIHVKSSDWYRHHHQLDAAYDQVVLHVVWEDDRPVTDMHLNPLPTLVLEPLVDRRLLQRTRALLSNSHRLPCHHWIGRLSPFFLNSWLEHQVIERLEIRTGGIIDRLNELRGDWEQVAFEYLARSMGFHANSEQLQALARDVTWSLVRKVSYDGDRLQALLFGRAGFLSGRSTDSYVRRLRAEYLHLRNKFNLAEARSIRWNFKSSRPPNFPTVRLAQLAVILCGRPSLIRQVTEASHLKDISDLFDADLPDFWDSHYTFKKESPNAKTKLGRSSVRLLAINYALPLLYAYGLYKQDEELKDRAIRFLKALPPEKNKIIQLMKEAGVDAKSAAESQALLHTYKFYCTKKRCLDCEVGARIV